MNRKIVFRGKDLQTKEWRHGYLYRLKLPSGFANMILVGDDVEIEMDNSSSPRHHLSFTLEKDLYAVSSDTIGQFTGLQDSNGNDIYEGDILHSPSGNIVAVEFGYKEHIVKHGWPNITDSFACYGWIARNVKKGITDFFDNEFAAGEVIGNRWDNPELLKGGEKWIED